MISMAKVPTGAKMQPLMLDTICDTMILMWRPRSGTRRDEYGEL
jgi:hypothetical protein